MQKNTLTLSRRRVKRQRFLKKCIIFLCAVAVAAGLTVGFFSFKYFKITETRVEGLKSIDEKIIKERAKSYLDERWFGIIPKANIILASKDDLAVRIARDIPKIKTIKITKTFPRTIKINITERMFWANVCNKDNCFYAGEDGVLFERTPKISGTVFFSVEDRRETSYDIGDNFIAKEDVSGIILIINKIEEQTGEKFSHLTIDSDNAINYYELVSIKKWKIIIDSLTDSVKAADNFINSYKNFLEKDLAKIDYIDLRLDNKIFYKNK